MLSLPLPQEYVAIPVLQSQQQASIQICAVVRREPEEVGGYLVLRRDTLDAKIYLGCISDQRGPIAYVDLWVQDLELFADTQKTLFLSREALSNLVLDDRWKSEFRTVLDGSPSAVIKTGWEEENPPPTLFDVSKGVPVHLGERDERWELCRNDELLKLRGLPAYSTSLHRYLYQSAQGDNTLFAPLSAKSPTNSYTVDLDSIAPSGSSLQRFNIGGGLMQVRLISPTRLQDCVNVLGGAPWNGMAHGKSYVRLGSLLPDGVTGIPNDGWLSVGQHNRDSSRFAEAYYLKLCLFADMVNEVRTRTERTKRPLLNLRPGSFSVSSPPDLRRLPSLWNIRALLTDPGDAIPLKIPLSDTRRTYYVPGKSADLSIYRPREATETKRGEGSYFAESVSDTAATGFVVHGTFDVREMLRVAKNDILFMRLNAAGNQRIDLYADVDRRHSIGDGRLRFHTVGQRFTDPVKKAMTKMVGLVFDETYFEIIPLLNSAVDLYSLGVMGIELFLVNKQTTLPRMLNNFYELTLRIEQGRSDPVAAALPLMQRVANIFKADARFFEMLGPQWMIHDEVSCATAREFITDELWFDTLAMLVKMFAGKCKDALCEDYGDAPLNGLHLIYDPIVADLDRLLVRARSLMLIDWNFNRDVTWAIQKLEDESRH